MSEQPNQDQPTVPAWALPPAAPEPTAPLPGLPQAYGGYPQGAGTGGYGAPGQPGGPYPAPAYGGGRPPRPGGGGRTAVVVISVLAVLGTAVAAVAYATGPKGHSSPVAFQTSALPLPTGSANPLGSPSPGPDDQSSAPAPETSEPGFDSPTAEAFDWNSLNSSSTDPTPFTQDSLLPQSFVDSQNITYALEAAGEKKCVQSTMSENVQSVLDKYGCKEAMTGSYLEDSSVEKVSSNNDILISVQIWPFPDATTATAVEKALAAASNKQFSIWCPTTGPGAAPCNSQNYYSAASWWSLQSDYRYVVEATAVYTNMTQDTSVAYKWEKTATAEAIKESGPQVYAADQ